MSDGSDDDAELLAEVVTAPQAWCEWQPLEDRWPGRVAALAAAGWLELWDRPDYLAVCLTPWGAVRARVKITEQHRFMTVTRERRNDRGRLERYEARVIEVYPAWVSEAVDDTAQREFRRKNEIPLHLVPEPAAKKPAPVLTDDDGEPVTLWGRPVTVDPRLGRRGKAG